MDTPDHERRFTVLADDHTSAWWRVEAVERLARSRAERQAGASPTPAFPAMLNFMVPWLSRSRGRLVIDVGAGLGGITDAIRERIDLPTVAVDRSLESCRASRQLFGPWPTLVADAHAVPVRSRSAGALLLAGVLSLDHGPQATLAEMSRVLVPGGHLIIIDLVSGDESDHVVGPNRFRSFETLEAMLHDRFAVVDRAVGSGMSGEWNLAAGPVTRVIADTHRSSPWFESWIEHQRHLERVLSSGEVLIAGLVARVRS